MKIQPIIPQLKQQENNKENIQFNGLADTAT